jgi:Protein of unknown function (DUF1214)
MRCRVLYVSGSLGLGHVTRDLAIATEMRRMCPDVDIAWIAGSPASEALAAAGERLVPEQPEYRGETDLAEGVARKGRLSLTEYVFRALAAWFHNARLIGTVASQGGFDVIVGNETYEIPVANFFGMHVLPRDTKYLGVGVRIQVFNPKDEDEVALINKLQDQFIIKANSADPLPKFKWDLQSLKALTVQYEKESTQYSSWKGMMGPRGQVDEKTRHIAAAAAWGLFPEWDATYLNYSGGHDYRVCHQAAYQVPENDAFWSITVYGNDGFMKSDKNIVNSSNVKLNADGTFTVYFGSVETCGDRPNRLDTTEGWNFLMRIYRPGKSVLEGAYKLPAAKPMK